VSFCCKLAQTAQQPDLESTGSIALHHASRRHSRRTSTLQEREMELSGMRTRVSDWERFIVHTHSHALVLEQTSICQYVFRCLYTMLFFIARQCTMNAERDIVMVIPSVCPSVCLSTAGSVSKQTDTSPHFFKGLLRVSFYFCASAPLYKIPHI